jgi:hypothetical protein
MSLFLVLSLQAAAVATPAAPAPPPADAPPEAARPRWAMPALIATSGAGNPLAFDLDRFRGSGSCLGVGAADVLVCGPRRSGGGGYPMAHWARIFGPEPPIRAEMNLARGVQGRVYNEAVPMDRGAVSNRALIGVRTRF